MAFIYYLVGAAITFVGTIIYRYVSGNGVYLLNQINVTDTLFMSLVAGVSFFLADFLMSKTKSS